MGSLLCFECVAPDPSDQDRRGSLLARNSGRPEVFYGRSRGPARVALLPLPRLIELKLASGMTASPPDLADVIDLVRSATLQEGLATQLDPYVRHQYLEVWRAEEVEDPQQFPPTSRKRLRAI